MLMLHFLTTYFTYKRIPALILLVMGFGAGVSLFLMSHFPVWTTAQGIFPVVIAMTDPFTSSDSGGCHPTLARPFPAACEGPTKSGAGNWEALTKSSHCHSLLFNPTYCNGVALNMGSKLYGFPKRRKVSAIRDFPVGCGIHAECTLDGCLEISKDLPLPHGLVTPEIGTGGYTETTKDFSTSCQTAALELVSRGDTDTITSSVGKNNSADYVKIIKKPLDEVAVPSTDKKTSFNAEDVIEKSIDPETGTVNAGKAEENMQGSTNLGITNSLSYTSLIVEEANICRSIIYGSPKRRKKSAIRDFPAGCGACMATFDRNRSVDIHSVPIQKNLEISTVESLPLGEICSSTGDDEGAKSISNSSECKESVTKVSTVGNERKKFSSTADYSREEGSQMDSMKEKMDSQTSGVSLGVRRLKKVVKKVSTPLAKTVKETDEGKDVPSFESSLECTTNALPLDVKPLRAVSTSGAEKKQQLGNAIFPVKGCSNEKVVIEHNEKSIGVVSLLDRPLGTGKLDIRKSEASKPLNVVGKAELESDVETPVRKSAGDKPGSRGGSRKDRLPVNLDAADRKKSFSQQTDEKMDLEMLGEKIIILGLMAAPNCPWRHGRGSVMSGRGAGTSVEKPKRAKKMNKRTDPSNTSNQLAIVPVGDEDQQFNLDGHLLLDDDINEIDFGASPVAPNSNEIVPLHGLLPLTSISACVEGDEVTRNKVRKTLRLFQVICRKLSQEEESKVKGQGKSRRVDLDATKLLKEQNACVNTGKAILGAVPGVEVGDEFHYRAELTVIGLHRLYQGGIDYIKLEGRVFATSIVSGGNEDEIEGSGVLIYSGSGGSPGTDGKPPEDQKLERGNLSLKNSMEAQKPVRVIRGSKELKTDPRDGRPKQFSTYVYDGLYIVEKYWKEKVQQGYFAFKFQLRRIPGQPELPLKEVKKSGKSSSRPGVCIKDISDGKEAKPICVVNTIDDERPFPFKYITKIRYPLSCVHAPPKGCDCTDGCSDSEMCACAVKNGGEIPFTYNGLIVQARPLAYECGPSCKCSASCHNRVSQHGVKVQLEVFKTKMSGWGVRSLASISSGTFICEYVGELLPDFEAEQRSNSDEYLFDIGNNYDDASLWEGLPSVMQPSNATESVEDAGFAIDACLYGNVGRFVNHSCSPNLYAQSVLYDHDDRRMPHIMLFAAENIPPLQELTYHYNYKIDQVRDKDGNIKRKDCHCGSQDCVGRLY